MNLTDVCRLLLYVHLVNKYSCPEGNIIIASEKKKFDSACPSVLPQGIESQTAPDVLATTISVWITK